MISKAEILADKLLNRGLNVLPERERKIVDAAANDEPVSRNINHELDDRRTFGEKVADGVANFGGSWTFIFSFAGVLILWVILNSYILEKRGAEFDAYPYILLNLFLSMLAAIQAPVIMMSQNRQAARDRLAAAHDYEVNLKAELEIRRIHEKMDNLREQKWTELVEMQQQQIRLLEKIVRDQMKTHASGIY